MPGAIELAGEYWRLMNTNDFTSVGAVLAPEFTLHYPQSGELIRGADKMACLNAEYPAQGHWTFTINRLVGGDSEAVSDVTVTDGVVVARAISFFTVSRGKIAQMVEYWPEAFPPPANRTHLVEKFS